MKFTITHEGLTQIADAIVICGICIGAGLVIGAILLGIFNSRNEGP